jgi:hypothetical protein
VDLKTLDIDHPLRNKPLVEIGAFYKPIGAIAWREVYPSFNIASKTFNQLAPCWTNHDEWKATKALPDTAEPAASRPKKRLPTKT